MADDLTPQEAQKIGIDAYIYGYALITSDVTGAAFVNITAPDPKTFQAPINQFVNLPKYPPADYHGVTAPNADTLYSGAFFDVSKEPIIFTYLDMHGRYFLFPIYSEWTNVISAPGKRTLGTGPQTIAITGPAWQGALPEGITQQVKSPTGSAFIINGWLVTTGTGAYGMNYLWRAGVSAYGWGPNLQEDAVYPSTKADADGAPLVGTNTYIVHFAKGETPPVDGLWSITMYDSEYYFYPNPLNKLTVSPRDKLTFNADGSLDLYFSHEKPASAPQANWLPAPAGQFILMMV